jgi:hypothetical protein
MRKKKRLKRVFRYKIKVRFGTNSFSVYANSLQMLKVNFATRVHQKLKMHAILMFRDADQITSEWWIGSSVTSCNKRIFWEVFDLIGQTSHAGQVLGAIGGSNGTGESKRRGNAEYYNKLRLLGLKKRRENKLKKSEKDKK